SQRAAVLSGRHPHLQSVFEDLIRRRREIGRKTLDGPAPDEPLARHLDTLAGWQRERERIEEQLAREIPAVAFEERLRHADASSVARALPAGSALVEFVRVRVRDFQADEIRGPSGSPPVRY